MPIKARVLHGSKATQGKVGTIVECKEREDGFWYTLSFKHLGWINFHESDIEIL